MYVKCPIYSKDCVHNTNCPHRGVHKKDGENCDSGTCFKSHGKDVVCVKATKMERMLEGL
jgi:hypothetical protein